MIGRRIALLLLFLAPGAAPLRGQEPVRVTPQGVIINFQGADLRLVLSGLAEAGGINLVYGDLPSKPVTLQMSQPVAKDALLPLIRNLARSNGLTVTEEGGFFRIASADPNVHASGASGDSTGEGPRLFTYRLRHARATRLSATLQSVFGGGAATGAPAGLRPLSLSEGLRSQRDASAAYGAAPAPASTTAAPTTGLPGQLQGEVQIVADEGTNALLVRALPIDWEVIQSAIRELDQRPQQVLIEVLIAEVKHSSGLDVNVTGKIGNNRVNPTATGELTSTADNAGLLLQVMRAGSPDQKLLLSMLASRGSVQVVSRPVLLAQNNLESHILVGSQRPFVQVSRSLPTDAGSRDQIVQYRDVGTKLSLTPTINDDGYVNLEVLQEVSNATDAQQFDAPIIDTREAATHLFLRDGQTGVIGGLVDREVDDSRSGIPILKDIPLLGFLFGATKHSTVDNELFIFLTPYVLNDDADMDRVRHAIERNSGALRDVAPGLPPVVLPPDSVAAPAHTP